MNMGSIIALIKSLGGGGSVPKPLTYDYMPEGYPTKIVQYMTLLDENLTLDDIDGSGVLYVKLLQKTVEISAGTTYKVIFNGTEYNCTAFDYDGMIILGNLSIIDESGDDTGEPFMIMPIPDYNNWTYIYAKTTNCTISISGDTTVYNVMSDDFLPKYTKLIKLPVPEVTVKEFSDALDEQESNGALIQWGGIFILRGSTSGKTIEFYADGKEYSVSSTDEGDDLSQCYLNILDIKEVIPEDEAKTLLVKFEPDESGFVANKTYSEMLDAFNTGKILIGRGPNGLTMCGSIGAGIDFVGFQCAYGTWIGMSISVSSDNVITTSSYQLTATQLEE